MTQTSDRVTIETAPDPQAAVIWLHGLGADGHDFEPIVPELGLAAEPAVRFVFPHAPVRPVTVNGGVPMRAWFDIDSLDRDMSLDEAGLRESRERVGVLYAEALDDGIPPDRIVIAGFSQGGAVALASGLTLDPPPAGILALSTFIPSTYRARLTRELSDRDLPVFMAHGELDPLISIEFGRSARDYLIEQGLDVEWHEYAMPHAVCQQEIADVGRWLRSRFE